MEISICHRLLASLDQRIPVFPGDERPSGSPRVAHCDSACLWIKRCAGCSHTSAKVPVTFCRKGTHFSRGRFIWFHSFWTSLVPPDSKLARRKRMMECIISCVYSCVFSTFYHPKYIHRFDHTLQPSCKSFRPFWVNFIFTMKASRPSRLALMSVSINSAKELCWLMLVGNASCNWRLYITARWLNQQKHILRQNCHRCRML